MCSEFGRRLRVSSSAGRGFHPECVARSGHISLSKHLPLRPRLRAGVVFAFVLAGCSTVPVVIEPPAPTLALIASITLPGNHRLIAACAFKALDGPGVTKADLPLSITLSLDEGGVRFWQLVFQNEFGRTRVDYSTVVTEAGPDTLQSLRLLRELRACATTRR